MLPVLLIPATLSTLIGLFASLFIGITLGLIGGGGSILTVPVLVYLFHVEPLLATTYSLFIVGLSSGVGTIPKYKEGLINLKTTLLFGIPSITLVFVTRRYILPAIPNQIDIFHTFTLTKNSFILLLFALLMMLAAVSMIKTSSSHKQILSASHSQLPNAFLSIAGIGEGFLTGLVGAGGGFLIIPVLVKLMKLPMKQAIGTSLFIIAIKSTVGFLGDVNLQQVEWPLLGSVAIMAILGILIGNKLGRPIDGEKLKKGFGWFVLMMGIYILVRETMGSGH
jgi:uncharacterized membrane protein YfcA